MSASGEVIDKVLSSAASSGHYTRSRDAVLRVNVALLGYGRVGQAVAAVAAAEHQRLRDAGLDLRITGALIRDPLKSRLGPPIPLHTTAASLFETRAESLFDHVIVVARVLRMATGWGDPLIFHKGRLGGHREPSAV